MKKGFLIGLSVLFFGSLVLMLRTGKEMSGDLQIRSGSSIEGIRILQKKNGATVWTLTADRADFMEGDDKAELSNVSMMIPKNGLVLHADKGIYDLSDKSFKTECIVKADTKDYNIVADSMDYDVSSGKVKTGGRVKIESKRLKVEGKGMDADEGEVKVFNDVTATFNKK
jgi:lipopolysaccharide assembly outer membrane protein LptD (OstA)